MARGRKLPTSVELSDDGSEVRCKICIEHSAGSYSGAWIRKPSYWHHQQSLVHIQSEECKNTAEIRAAALQAERVQEECQASFAQLCNFSMVEDDITMQNQCGVHEQEMWRDHKMNFHDNGFKFDAGDDPGDLDQQKREEFDHRVHEHGLWSGIDEIPGDVNLDGRAQLWDKEDHDDLLSEVLQNLEDEDETLPAGPSMPNAPSNEWFPYDSKLSFLLDAIDNLLRLRISGSLMRVLLWLLREVGVKKVPSFDALRKSQKHLRTQSSVPTIPCVSPKGNVFSFNDPRTLIANQFSKDWANPLVCPHLRRYAMIPPNGVISEVWHAQQWRKEMDRHCLSPMYDDGYCHFYIDEPARLKDGTLVIPVRWLEDSGGSIWANAWRIEYDDAQNATIVDDSTVLLKATDLQDNMLDLQDAVLVPTWSLCTIGAGHPSRMPNPDRALAEGDPLYVSLIDVFGDDVSGNRSKSWNKHWNIYISHRNLPQQLLHQQFHVHFVSTSPHASVSEQFHGIKETIESTHHKPVKVQHAITGKQVRFKIYCNCGPGDNPAQSELSGHIGAKGNFYCQKCNVGGTQKNKETDEGFHSLFYPGELHSAAETLAGVKNQVKLACLSVAAHVKDAQTRRARVMQKAHPTRPVAKIQAELMVWVKDHEDKIYNPFLVLEGFDAARDTPVEILHTILLGVVKYLWHGSHTPWTASQQKIYSMCLQGTNTLGLSIHAIHANYIMQYANSLIGRQLKTLAQVNVFHVHGLVDDLGFTFTRAVGELSALLYYPKIRNLDEYLSDVDVAAANVLDIAALIDPSKTSANLGSSTIDDVALHRAVKCSVLFLYSIGIGNRNLSDRFLYLIKNYGKVELVRGYVLFP
ncbi:hypothetical protein BDZ94DRAFT_1303006 [Collybia nuda]|uniref:Uncharacterized protein n=1 Tax=Collybia nuda TaxID=64659 RepID=A0A9P6C7W3_9AGAR|nr:hypothetical protein BDZ94DRAFT_1303006 [Collybia nuda]